MLMQLPTVSSLLFFISDLPCCARVGGTCAFNAGWRADRGLDGLRGPPHESGGNAERTRSDSARRGRGKGEGSPLETRAKGRGQRRRAREFCDASVLVYASRAHRVVSSHTSPDACREQQIKQEREGERYRLKALPKWPSRGTTQIAHAKTTRPDTHKRRWRRNRTAKAIIVARRQQKRETKTKGRRDEISDGNRR